ALIYRLQTKTGDGPLSANPENIAMQGHKYSISLQARRNIPARSRFATAKASAHTNFAKVLLFGLDHFETAHIGLQNIRHGNRAALLLICLHNRDQRTANCRTGAVQRVHKMRLAVAAAITRVHPPRLKIAAHRAARNLPERAALAL